MKHDVIFDMETSDPDDAMTVLFLMSHLDTNLRAITITPGTVAQYALVKTLTYSSIPIGVKEESTKSVSSFHYKWLGNPVHSAVELMKKTVDEFPDTILLTGAALHNPYDAILNHGVRFKKWVAQGGFAGEGVVPPEYQLEKFKGMATCPTFNFNGNPKAALHMLETDAIGERILVSKNVCHGIRYDKEMHEIVGEAIPIGESPLKRMYEGMELYLQKRPEGKMFHDPLAASAIVNPDIFEWRTVEMYREKGKWGSRLKDGTNTQISIKADREKFIQELIKRPYPYPY